jgi:hypothetical protein
VPFGELGRAVKSAVRPDRVGARVAHDLQPRRSPRVQRVAAIAIGLSMNGGWLYLMLPILSGLNWDCITGI